MTGQPEREEWICGHVAGAMCAECYRQLANRAADLARENEELRERLADLRQARRMNTPRTMSKAEMEQGLRAGRQLIQEEWSHPDEIGWADELIAEGKAVTNGWEYHDGFQCERRIVQAG